jgi:4-hydroxy-2-oxoheptanedioate aldolase
VPGIDAIFVGPNDLAASLRKPDGTPPSKQLMEDTLTRIREASARNKVSCGLHVYSAAEAQRRIDEGWQFIAVGSELKFMLEGASAIVKQLNPERTAGEMAKY